jgi:kynurenine formamidase
MRFRGFVIAYALVLALLLFADQRHAPSPQSRYSHVIDLTNTMQVKINSRARPRTRIIAPAALIPGTWSAGQIPAERLIGPLVVMDLNSWSAQISVEDIANWEARHGAVPPGAIVAVRGAGSAHGFASDPFPFSTDAVRFLMDARDTRGFVVESSANLGSERELCRQIALHGNFVVEGPSPLTTLPLTGSLIIVAPEKNGSAAESPVRVLAMVG